MDVAGMRAAALADAETDRFHVRDEEAVGNRMPNLMAGHGQRLLLRVLDGLGQAGLDVGHGLTQIVPDEAFTSVLEGVHQRHRQRLLDHRRRVALGDAGELLAHLRIVQSLVVADPGEVEVGDVLAVLEIRHLEDDLAAEPPRTRDGLVQHLRPVGRAHEEDVVAGRLQRRDTQ